MSSNANSTTPTTPTNTQTPTPAATPAAPASNPDPPNPRTPNVDFQARTGALIPATISGVPSTDAAYDFPLAAHDRFTLFDGGARYDFRSHERVTLLLQLFARVELVWVQVYLSPSHGHGYNANGSTSTRSFLFRYGLAPRTIETHTGAVGTDYTALGSSTPRLATWFLSPVFPQPAVTAWDINSFPPGMQLDLRAVETRHPYPRLYISNLSPTDAATTSSIRVVIDFVVRCSGSNFGGAGL